LRFANLLSTASRSEPLGRVRRMQSLRPPSDAISFTRMQPPADLIPHELFRRCLDHVMRAHGSKAMSYAPKDGFPELRELVAADLARHGVPAAADDIVITTGSQQGLDLIARTLLDPGDLVVTHASTYAGALQVFAATGARVVGIASDPDGPDLDALRRVGQRRPKLLYLMPNHVNPTGACMSSARRESVLAWARDTQV